MSFSCKYTALAALATAAVALGCQSRAMGATIYGVQLYNSKGTAITDTQTAGVIAQSHFNVEPATGAITGPLMDQNGSTTAGLTFSYSGSNDGYSSGTGNGTDADTLLSSKVGATKATATFNFGNVPVGTYDLIAYTLNNNGPYNVNVTLGSTTFYVIDETGATFMNGGTLNGTAYAANAYVQASNTTNLDANRDTGTYVEFTNYSQAALGNLSFTVTGVGNSGDISAVQLVAVSSEVPEPCSLALLGCGAMGLLARRRRRA